MAMALTRSEALDRTVALPDRYTFLPWRGCTGRKVLTMLFPSGNFKLENALSCKEENRSVSEFFQLSVEQSQVITLYYIVLHNPKQQQHHNKD